ncbi:MAG: amidohydrolase family protein [Desulfomonilaceae bacterium]|nr:amidohydrolase family protein [Desulfomonilaceae bacterium]
MLQLPLPGLDDPEGHTVPDPSLSVCDAHVHLFPDAVFQAMWNWFDNYAWPVRYRLTSPEIVKFLHSKGVRHVVGLHYAHKPGIAGALNRYMAGLCAEYPSLTGTATVFPGEKGTREILEEGFELGLSGVKLHAHVQCFHLDGPGMNEIYEACVAHDKPLVMHVGREPRNPDYPYPVDPYVTCDSGKLERVLSEYPSLRICVPHMGADEFAEYRRMSERYDNLWLDIAMVAADYLPNTEPPRLAEMRTDRIMYGSDFPNIPYAWDRELKKVHAQGLPRDVMERILGLNCLEFFSISA